MNRTRRYVSSENMFDVFMIAFLLTFNVFFSIFVWMPSDLSPNQAIGLLSLVFISIQIYRIVRRNKKFLKGEQHE